MFIMTENFFLKLRLVNENGLETLLETLRDSVTRQGVEVIK